MKNTIVMLGTLLLIVALLFGLSRQAVMGQDATATPAEEATAMPSEEATAAPAEEATAAPAEEAAEGMTQTVTSLAEVVRQSTDQYQEVKAAEDAGFALAHGCVSGPNGGAMGVHYANGDLVGDGEIDAQKPEALIYEQSYGQLHLVGVEYIVLAEAWDANHDAAPVLMGQLFNLNGAPNRYGLPAFYELHVWAWKHNPTGMFADWNPNVSCEEYTGDATMTNMGQ